MRRNDCSVKEILLVEDNPDDVELTLRALRQKNVANPIIVATDGVEALDYLFGRGKYAGAAIPPLPALVLLDLKLPKLEGLEVLREIRENKRTTLVPVVILTSSKEESDLVQGYRLRANAYIRKPVDFGQFADAIQTLGFFWLVLNETPPVVEKPC